jgi:hypothetical protein
MVNNPTPVASGMAIRAFLAYYEDIAAPFL